MKQGKYYYVKFIMINLLVDILFSFSLYITKNFTYPFLCKALHKKGHVERSVEYVRRKAFGLKDHFTDIKEAESWLLKTLDKLNNQKQVGTGKSAMEIFEEEKKSLLPLPSSRLLCAEQVQLRVDKYATVSYRTNRYSVPDHLVGKFVDVTIRSKDLDIYYEKSQVATHHRSFDKHAWIVDIEHYLSTFKRKPGALAGSVALAGSTYLKNLYQEYFPAEARAFIDLLSYCRTNAINQEKLEETVKRLLSTVGTDKLTVEKLRALLGNKESVNTSRYITERQTGEDYICLMAKQQLSTLSQLLTCQQN